MLKLTVKDLLELKGVRQIVFVQVAREEEALAAADVTIQVNLTEPYSVSEATNPASRYPTSMANELFL